MQRTKLLAVALATLTTLAVGVVFFTGGASAAEWHEYTGDIYAGHAYGLEVPADAEALEIGYFTQSTADGSAAAEPAYARLAVFDPAGALVGYYELSASPAAATIVGPAEGRYVIYVYEVVGGALQLRVSGDASDEALALSKIPLAREDKVLTRNSAPEALDQVFTAKLELAPVFVTLLYEGSVQNLDATVASTKGPVVTITDETGTAFSPGVWSSQTGVRDSDASKLADGAYTVTAKADRFEGTLVLTSLALDLRHREIVIEEPDVIVEPVPGIAELFEVPAHQPLGIELAAGTLVIANPEYIHDLAEHGEADENDYRYYGESLMVIYTPDDEILGTYLVDNENPMIEIDIPEAGEYVLYLASASDDFLFAKVIGAETVTLRELEVIETMFEFDDYEATFTLERAPIMMDLRRADGIGAFSMASVENANGIVASRNDFVALGPAVVYDYPHQEPANFAAGEHTFRVDGLDIEPAFTLRVVHYTREVIEIEEHAVEADHGDHEDNDDAPAPTVMPTRVVERLLGLFG